MKLVMLLRNKILSHFTIAALLSREVLLEGNYSKTGVF